ncbi:DUF1152 domain-containing protein [Dactylosporangium vinaceum]|nr:DUF1152 domain-containing protein [Dactylosporangium vinaceum]
MIAAGGGGDAIAAAVLGAATAIDPVGIATMAWDRLLVDPLPGPRCAADFRELTRRPGYDVVTVSTHPIAPAGSALPRLSGELDVPIVLLDPTPGAVGMREQLSSAARDLGAEAVTLVDVGGDLIGRPGDAGLRSPLADALTAAACTDLPARAWIAGPGLDGELPERVVLERIGDRPPRVLLTAEHWKDFLSILSWHPSEATALLAAASLGVRGAVEIRGAGLLVPLTDLSAAVFELPLGEVAEINPLIRPLSGSTSLAQAEQRARDVLGSTELDEERSKAARLQRQRPAIPDVPAALRAFEAEARDRGADYVTFRRLGEMLGQPDMTALRTLRAEPGRAGAATSVLWDLRPRHGTGLQHPDEDPRAKEAG